MINNISIPLDIEDIRVLNTEINEDNSIIIEVNIVIVVTNLL